MAALKGLAPVSVLLNIDGGKAALGANYTVTEGIQTGAITQPILLPFPEQQEQALRDAFITGSNLTQLTDGLGTTLGSAYLAHFHYIDQKQTSKLPQSIGDLISYATAMSGAHSNAGKYLFANATTDGKTPVSSDQAAIVKEIGGVEDIFGKAYKLPAGIVGADAYGNSRPYQTEPSVTQFVGPDYLNTPAGNYVYNHGPIMDLTNSPSYPSGHTTYGYTGAVLLAVLVPERYAQMIARGAEYGNDRIIMRLALRDGCDGWTDACTLRYGASSGERSGVHGVIRAWSSADQRLSECSEKCACRTVGDFAERMRQHD
jgi:hypothetical protein